ncbi:MAG: TrmH family RNA methyltransferase, partial [Shewanella sp.]
MSSSTTTMVDAVASPQAQQAVYIGLVNPKTPTNVGGIMRASG